MNEAIAQSIAFTRAVVVAAGAQARDQRMIDRLLVVAVVAGSVLFAMHFDGEAVDVNRGPFDATASRSDHVFLDALGQSVSDRFEVTCLFGQDADQSGLSGLACQSFIGDGIACAIPDSGAKRRVMGESVNIVLSRAAHGHGKDAFTNQFVDQVAYAVGTPWVADVLGDLIEQTKPMLGLAEQDDSGMGGDSMIGRLNFDGAIELGLEKATLVFTHRVNPRCV